MTGIYTLTHPHNLSLTRMRTRIHHYTIHVHDIYIFCYQRLFKYVCMGVHEYLDIYTYMHLLVYT